MFWYIVLIIAGLCLAWLALRMGRRTVREDGDRQKTLSETSEEIASPPKGTPSATEETSSEGSLREKDLRTDKLSKEVELDWEASSVIERQPGAYASSMRRESQYSLPRRYNRDRLVLMARDPRWIYAYWEIASEKSRDLREKRLREWGLSRPVLRLYDITDGRQRRQTFDVNLTDDADNWYIEVNRPRHHFIAEVGRYFPDGFVPLVRSNEIILPPDLPSMELGEEWASMEWYMKYGRFLGKEAPSSPGAWGKKVEG